MASNHNTGQSTSQDNPPSSTGSLGKRKAGEQASQNPSSSSSPRKAGNTSAPPPSLHAARDELVKKYIGIPEKSVEAFFHDLVPKVAQDVVDEVMRKLKEGVDMPKAKNTRKSNEYIALEQDGTVRGYGGKGQDTPAKSNLSEASAFHGLCMLINATIELAAKLNGCSWVAHSSKQDRISGEKRNSSRPDSFLYLAPQLMENLGWEQLLCSGEFKKREDYDTRLDNWAKVLWGMHHIMRNDPCRLFTFGYTMENTGARLWYHARSSVFVSELFDWVKNPEPFVKFILGLALTKPEHFQQAPAPTAAPTPTALVNFGAYDAPPRKAQGIDVLYADHGEYLERIGIDSTMKRVLVGEIIQYEITVAGQVFVTEKVLCDFKADHATGRTTRVWVVYVKGSDRSTEYVLKDVWLEEGAKVEGDKLDELQTAVDEAVKKDKDAIIIGNRTVEEMAKWHKDHFLHKYKHQKYDQTVPGAQGEHPRLLVVRDTTVLKKDVSSVHSGSQREVTQGGPPPAPPQGPQVFDYPERFHYRIVYHGVMTPLEEVSSRKASSQVVIGVFRACWVLWAYGMVHRDVSSWNVFWDPNTNTGRLGDFDYLAEYGKSGTGTTKTGTPHFWSIEVEANCHLHLHTPQLTLENADGLVARLQASMQNPEPTPDPPLFQHNLLHDLESVYWVGLWTFLYLIDDEDRDDNGDANSVRKELYKKVFPEGHAAQAQLDRSNFLTRVSGSGSAASLWKENQAGICHQKIQRLVFGYFTHTRASVVSYFKDAEQDLGPGNSIPYQDPQFARALTELYGALLYVDSELGDYKTFPVTPLVQHKYVLPGEPGPYDLVRWPDDEDDEEEPDAAPGPSRTSNQKRQKTNA
ncbi:hypothetical protein V5O48_011924 [Marasmius crinis-equi]|uniref:Fungal-type protein kinase domain-containing protein n=1 Tax=Marasmius crinis-equi TaxID=585013 RepID=A0ABR3F4L9_9AGAR